ncbi:ral-GDS-related protein-like [Diceros bicornis minor]|uniref:ral-GDS-related protein-like n=1 Tax=Diceros bicornis minor TaxID=77932 RepID=UPI0026EF44E4|nr:ral-GDS-related protein-like [Diceros bicornis minor]
MDVELFKTVRPHEFLDSIWSQCDNWGNEHLAPTIHATMTHFNRVVECIVTTCIGDPSMTAQVRARVVELWIQVAKVRCGRPWEPLSGVGGTAPSPFSALMFEVRGLSLCTILRPLLPGLDDLTPGPSGGKLTPSWAPFLA